MNIQQQNKRFVLGDRFHSSSNPYISRICLYHDLNNSTQVNSLKTSYQESDNNKKNKKRLQSACVKNFHMHYFYNFLMDFYQNEATVEDQQKAVEGDTGKRIVSREIK